MNTDIATTEPLARQGGSITLTAGPGFPEDRRFLDAGKINFCIVDSNEPILVIDRDGILYKGERVEDAGKAHEAFMSTIGAMVRREKM